MLQRLPSYVQVTNCQVTTSSTRAKRELALHLPTNHKSQRGTTYDITAAIFQQSFSSVVKIQAIKYTSLESNLRHKKSGASLRSRCVCITSIVIALEYDSNVKTTVTI